MSSKRGISSLLSPQSMGGDFAEGGFQYQANLITARVPGWLSHDGFTDMIRESLGDTEARFFVPGRGTSREFVEYKNHHMAPGEFWSEIDHFFRMNFAAPGAYHKFVLACTGISENLKTVINALRRVRDASPFYDGSSSIQDESYADFVQVVKDQGSSEGLAHFLFSMVYFEIDLTDAEDHPRELFREALFKNFPSFEDLPARTSGAAYLRLVELIKSRKNKPIRRSELEDAIWGSLEPAYRPPDHITIHTLHTESCHRGRDGCLQCDWMNVFGGDNRCYPPAEQWHRTVIGQLEQTRDWILSTNRPRMIHLSGNRRLSASVAIGSVFSAVSGFTITVKTKDGIWRTDSYPLPETPDYLWAEDFIPGGSTRELALGIGITKNVAPEFNSFLNAIEFEGARLCLFGNQALLSSEHANSAVDEAKKIILRHIASVSAARIHLFMAVPSQFALFFGHRLNATCPIQCYERRQVNEYTPTCLIFSK